MGTQEAGDSADVLVTLSELRASLRHLEEEEIERLNCEIDQRRLTQARERIDGLCAAFELAIAAWTGAPTAMSSHLRPIVLPVNEAAAAVREALREDRIPLAALCLHLLRRALKEASVRCEQLEDQLRGTEGGRAS